MKESGTYIMLYEQVKIQEKSISAVSRETCMSRNTIRKYLVQGEQRHASLGKVKGSKPDPYKVEIRWSKVFTMPRLSWPDRGNWMLRHIQPLRPPALRTGPAIRRYEAKPGKQTQMDWGILKYRNQSCHLCKVACFVMVLGPQSNALHRVFSSLRWG